MKITIKQIRDLYPCYDPVKYLPEDWEGSIIDILQVKEALAKDRIWVATRFLDDKTNRLFAVDCARRALNEIDNLDPRSLKAVDIAEKYAHGNATKEELSTVRSAACSAACSAAYDAACGAYRAACSAADYAACGAYRAACSAAYYAAWYAEDSNKEREIQVDRFIEVIQNQR